MKLRGRRILVTGAASGIGLQTVRLFADEGARLAIACRDQAAADSVLYSMQDATLHVGVSGDVTDQPQVNAMVDRAATALDGLDGVVHSAGIDHLATLQDTDLAQWNKVINGNMTSAFLICQAALAKLRTAGGGTIVTLASGAALLPLPMRTAYCAAKAGLVMFSKTLALELAADNVRVNALCPGAIDTPMLRESAGGQVGDPVPQYIVSRFAMGRVGEAEEVARGALFLTSSDSSFTTGAALTIDGGRTFH